MDQPLSRYDARYEDFARRLTSGHVITDPWLEGRPRLACDPLILTSKQYELLVCVGEAVTAVYDAVAALCTDDPGLVARYFAFTPMQRTMWTSSLGRWHGIARADVFLTPDGPRCCELNCDTPSGEAEAALLGALGLESAPEASDPNLNFEALFCNLIEGHAQKVVARPGTRPPSLGILYPTEIPEDLSMVTIYRQWLERRGWSVTVGSPFNLESTPDGGVALFGTACDVLIRHYKTDWWTERLPITYDQTDYRDALPLLNQYGALFRAERACRCSVVNPFGAILPQNKRAMALMWEEIARFPPWAQKVIRRVIPRTLCLESADNAELSRSREKWVLKSDYGCEGNEVLIGKECTQEQWDYAIARAMPRHWIVQELFQTREQGAPEINLGVYTICGSVAGIYSRLSAGATRTSAISVPTLIEPPAGRTIVPISVEARESGVMPVADRMPEMDRDEDPVALEALERLLAPRTSHLAHLQLSTLFHSVAREAGPLRERMRPISTLEMLFAEARGRSIASGFHNTERLRGLALVVDLPGPEAVALAAGLADKFEPVFLFGNVCHERGVVPAHLTVGACLHYARRFVQAAASRDTSAPPVFVYDSNRSLSYGADADRFDNRYFGPLPPFERLGTKRILFITGGDAEVVEPDDFNEDFCFFQNRGIEIEVLRANTLRPPTPHGAGAVPKGAPYRAVPRSTIWDNRYQQAKPSSWTRSGSLGRIAFGPCFQMKPAPVKPPEATLSARGRMRKRGRRAGLRRLASTGALDRTSRGA